MMRRFLLDPTGELSGDAGSRAASPLTNPMEGKVLGLLDITKPRGDVFLDSVAAILEGRGVVVRRYEKPTFTRVAPTDLRSRIAAECDAVVEALAD